MHWWLFENNLVDIGIFVFVLTPANRSFVIVLNGWVLKFHLIWGPILHQAPFFVLQSNQLNLNETVSAPSRFLLGRYARIARHE